MHHKTALQNVDSTIDSAALRIPVALSGDSHDCVGKENTEEDHTEMDDVGGAPFERFGYLPYG